MKAYATSTQSKYGKQLPLKNSSHNTLSDFKLDIHKILSSKSFRRLKGKTQVVIANTGDHYRDRLTHTIQVANTAQILAESLGLNQDLCKAIALAHDLGHTPFGHSGEDTMHAMMQMHNQSFEHNLQSIKVVSTLEKISPAFNGLNLHHETLLGLQKHNQSVQNPSGEQVYHSLESQVVNEADEITYLYHDLDDAFRGGLITLEDLKQLKVYHLIDNPSQQFEELIQSFYFYFIHNLVQNTTAQIQSQNIQTYLDVISHKQNLVIYSQAAFEAKVNLKQFLLKKFWTHPKVTKQRAQGEKIIQKLFHFFLNDPKKLPEKYQLQIQNGESIIEVVKDYIAGITDLYAKNTYIENALS